MELSFFDRRRRRITIIASCLIWIGGPAIVGIWRAYLPNWNALIPAVIAGWGMVLAQYIGRHLIQRVDSQERIAFGQLSDRVKKGANIPFALYLRPFWSDSVLRRAGPSHLNAPEDPQSIYEDPGHVETTLSQLCARRDVVLIKFGDPIGGPESRGAGNINAGEDWFAEFCDLAKRAQLVFVVPGGTPSSISELNWLKKNVLLGSVIALFPPHWMLKESAEEWEVTQARLESIGLELPGDRGFGTVIRWNGDGQIAVAQGILRWTRVCVSAAIAKVMGDLRWFIAPFWLKVILAPLMVPFVCIVFFLRFLIVWFWTVVLTTRNWRYGTLASAPKAVRIIMLPIGILIIMVMTFVMTLRGYADKRE